MGYTTGDPTKELIHNFCQTILFPRTSLLTSCQSQSLGLMSARTVAQSTFNPAFCVGWAVLSTALPAFCCSGQVPIAKESYFEKMKEEVADFQAVSPPVVIRWDRKDGSTIGKLTVPPDDYDAESMDQQALKDLLNNCAPASFGKDGADVIDECYRKAAKLDSDQFSTNFNPYDVGIIGAIAQTLLPGIATPLVNGRNKKTFVENLGVVAELYKLNVGALSPPKGSC